MKRLLIILALTLCIMGLSPAALAASPARSETAQIGNYLVDVGYSADPIPVEQDFTVTVTPHQAGEISSGTLNAKPGLGTDGIAKKVTLDTHSDGTLSATLSLAVRGAWQLVFTLDGSSGQGSGSTSITVASPDAIPVWLGWTIGLSPIIGVVIFAFFQRRYRRRLLAQAVTA